LRSSARKREKCAVAHLCSPLYHTYSREILENHKYLKELEAKLKNIEGGFSGAHLELFYKKGQNIS
jgi:hypothetical protein